LEIEKEYMKEQEKKAEELNNERKKLLEKLAFERKLGI
jgi:hypothetical protein